MSSGSPDDCARNLKGVDYPSDDDPGSDPEVQAEMSRLQAKR